MKRCWLHIGMHKTGSSSIQQNLKAIKNPEGWRLFFVGGRSNMGSALKAMFSCEPHKSGRFAKTGASSEAVAAKGARWREELRAGLMEVKEGNCIISAEGLSNHFSEESIMALKAFLEPLCDEIRVIGYVRPPMAFKISSFQEKIKHGQNEFNVSKIRLNYISMFKKFDSIFGESNVILRKFDPATFINRCLVADFCQQIGIKLPDNTPIKRVNESLSCEASGILFAYRKFGPGFGIGKNVMKENNFMMRSFRAMRGEKFNVSRSIIENALDIDRSDIEWMECRLGVSLKERDDPGKYSITSEEELLTIKRSSCEEFARCCREVYGIELRLDSIPEGDTVDPREVAKLVASYIEDCRRLMRMNRGKKLGKKRQAEVPARNLIGKSAGFFLRRFRH